MKHKLFFGVALIVVVGLFGWVSYTFYKAYHPHMQQLQGEITAQSYNISSKIPGRIGTIAVRKGELLKEGDLVFTIVSPELEAKLKQALAAKKAASSQKELAKNGARKEQIQAAKEQYEKAKAAQALMQKTYARIEKLYKAGVVSEQKRDMVQTKYLASKHTAEAAKQMLAMLQKGTREELKEAADAQEKVFEGKVDEVKAFAKETKQYAFHKGEVSNILIHEGELAPAGFPVVTLLDMDDVWARVSVREDLLHHFKIGKTIEVKIPALSPKESYRFKVSYIHPQGEYATWRASESGKGFDMKSFEVELRPLKKIEALRVGMSVLIPLQ